MTGLVAKIGHLITLPIRHHFWGSFAIVLVIAAVIGDQILDRHNFANVELHEDVMERWGAPIRQPAPSVRYVKSGTVFTQLTPLPLVRQRVKVAAVMNYRKRGLVYFSGFDFTFVGSFKVSNPEAYAIDAVFVFPVALERNKVLLSQLEFVVNGQPAAADLAAGGDKLVWTGRLQAGADANFDVRFNGRGLDSFVYHLDPSAPVRDFSLQMDIRGGDNFDYPLGVVPAHLVSGAPGDLSPTGSSSPDSGASDDERIGLTWNYPSLESGVPMGAVLPAEKSFDHIIATMLRRTWLPFIGFFVGLTFVAVHLRRRLRFFDAYLMAATYGFFYVLVAYLAAFTNFYLAFALAAAISGALMAGYSQRLLGTSGRRLMSGLFVTFLLLPSLAVLAQGYTGLFYTIEILSGLVTLVIITTRGDFADLVGDVSSVGLVADGSGEPS